MRYMRRGYQDRVRTQCTTDRCGNVLRRLQLQRRRAGKNSRRLKSRRKSETMKCADCENCKFEQCNGGVNRFYCTHPAAAASVNAGARLIARTERHSTELPVKTAPRWCPIKYDK
jgi:hypothetical protein